MLISRFKDIVPDNIFAHLSSNVFVEFEWHQFVQSSEDLDEKLNSVVF